MAFPNWLESSSVATPAIANSGSYGSWNSSLPSSNILDARLAKKARSTDTTVDSTKFQIDLGAPRNVDVIAIPVSNISTSGQIKISAFSDSGFSASVEAGSFEDYWADVYEEGTRPWGSPGILSPKFSEEEAEGYPAVFFKVYSNSIIAQYWQVEISDTSNTDGYVEIGRVVMAPAWQATLNPVPGFSLGWQTASTVVTGRTGVRFIDRQPSRRVSRFEIDYLPSAEALTYPFEMGRKQNMDGEIFFIFDPDDTVHRLRRAFLANLRTLPSLVHPSVIERNSVQIEIEEIL